MKFKGPEKMKLDFCAWTLYASNLKKFAGLCDKSKVLESILGSKMDEFYWKVDLIWIFLKWNFP